MSRTGDRSWAVYMLRCGDGSLYTGATNDLPARLLKHQRGKGAAYTRSRLPVRLVFLEAADDRSAALRREAALKRLTRAEKLALVKTVRKAALKKALSPGRHPAIRRAPRARPGTPRSRAASRGP